GGLKPYRRRVGKLAPRFSMHGLGFAVQRWKSLSAFSTLRFTGVPAWTAAASVLRRVENSRSDFPRMVSACSSTVKSL
ncbi:hypothetical protein, partial [Stutzerimonas nitrititolerans]|uniref:hypothetical protein n=1 Tax=Stutzerimonas nitrititolerans TaxID=2482751 RepID=UPI0028A7E7D5